MKSADQGRSFKTVLALAAIAFGITTIPSAQASLTIRDIRINGNQVSIQLDGVSQKSVDLDYVRDIVQFSIPNASIYPARIIHADHQAFSKVFAYQYAPNLVRVRFTVDGNATAFKGKVKWSQKGKVLSVSFPSAASMASVKGEVSDDQEKSLLAKVLGSSPKEKVQVEAIAPKTKSHAHKLTGRADESANVGHPNPLLAGQSAGPSVFRSFLAMMLVVGGLALVLVYVKRKKNSVQARKVGSSWLSNLLPNSMKKQKSFIEVVAQHALGPKHSITVVKIKGQQFVLAITPENLQLITQLDSDDAELDLLEDPAVAASIGKLFGSKPAVQAVPTMKPAAEKVVSEKIAVAEKPATGASFNTLLKNSDGAGAIMARRAYTSHGGSANTYTSTTSTGSATPLSQGSGIRDQIKKRLEGMRNA